MWSICDNWWANIDRLLLIKGHNLHKGSLLMYILWGFLFHLHVYVYICVCVCVCERIYIDTYVYISACNAGNLSSISGPGRSPGEGNGKPLQYSCLGNRKDRGACRSTVHGVMSLGHNLVTKGPPPPFFFKFFSHLGYYRVLSRVPCAIQ